MQDFMDFVLEIRENLGEPRDPLYLKYYKVDLRINNNLSVVKVNQNMPR
ncbi:MAG: hypothetical protein ACOYIB_01605 [Desulfosporosinus sp.]